MGRRGVVGCNTEGRSFGSEFVEIYGTDPLYCKLIIVFSKFLARGTKTTFFIDTILNDYGNKVVLSWLYDLNFMIRKIKVPRNLQGKKKPLKFIVFPVVVHYR